jgi:hypothetical protein
MTNIRADNPMVSAHEHLERRPMSPPPRSKSERWSIIIQLVLSLSIALGVLGYLLLWGGSSQED